VYASATVRSRLVGRPSVRLWRTCGTGLVDNAMTASDDAHGVRDDSRGEAAVHASYARTTAELHALIECERLGAPFLVWRSGGRGQVIHRLDGLERATIGRRASNTIALADDHEISRVHALLEVIGGDWTIVDDGLSSNGTYLNGRRMTQRRRLSDGDVVRVGQTIIEYRSPRHSTSTATSKPVSIPVAETLTDTQRRILVALSRPFRGVDAHATPATNSQIAAEVFLGVDAVKAHLRALFRKFGLADLPQNQKRARLVERAFESGVVSEREL
jgi:pSer/pThr/pTyr-binding forkhead associated (FHA) protein